MTLSSLSSKTSWHVLGAGATGCIWAAHMARAGTPCIMLAKGWSGTATVVVTHKQKVIFKEKLPVQNSQDLVCLRERLINRLLVLTKAPQAAQAICSVRDYLAPDAAVVLLGNGLLGVRDALLEESHARRIGSQDDATPSPDITHLCLLTHKQKLFLGSSTYGAHIVSNNIEEFCDAAAGPHTLSSEVWMATTTPKQQSLINRTITVEYSGRGSAWIGADTDGEGNDSLSHVIATELSTSGIPIEAVETVEVVPRLWQKLSLNAAINAATALARCKNGTIGSTSAGRELLEDICNECAPIAVKACDLQDVSNTEITTENYCKNVPGDNLVLNHPLVGSKELTRQALTVVRQTQDTISSMYSDIIEQRDTEIEFINCFISKKAQDLGLPSPINTTLCRVHDVESGTRCYVADAELNTALPWIEHSK